MSEEMGRREFVAGMGALAGAAALVGEGRLFAAGAVSPVFRVGVINDEIGEDFGRCCEVASKEFGMEWMELRGMWNKNIVKLDDKEVEEAVRILKRNNLRVTDIASPLFKVDWPGAPASKYRPQGTEFHADFKMTEQDEVLERSMELAKRFGTDRVRCFDFWRLENPAEHREAMNEKLREAAEKAGKKGLILVLENEGECNTATGAEAAKLLAAVKTPSFMLNWDPGNAAERGEKPFPDGYDLLPKERIGHCHCKDVKKNHDEKDPWEAMGRGVIDWVGQFRALKNDGYRYAVSLETHWGGAGTPEESTRQSWAGMKKELQEAGAL